MRRGRAAGREPAAALGGRVVVAQVGGQVHPAPAGGGEGGDDRDERLWVGPGEAHLARD
jgi:hypothetical protein